MEQDILPRFSFDHIPQFRGTFSTEETVRRHTADDFGHRVHQMPLSVLTPKTFEDVVQVVQFARQHHLKVAPRGHGHDTNGQAQVKDGIVIDMTGLDKILAIHEDRVEVEAGASWNTLLQMTLKEGLALPVVTNSLDLSIGGVLSVGGMGATSYRYGAVTDNVLELHVVTGEGQYVICSPTEQTELFESTLAGLGQCGIIVQATLRLIPAKTHARTFRLFYPDVDALMHDEKILVDDERFDGVLGNLIPTPQGSWLYILDAVSFYTPSVDKLDNEQLLHDLNFMSGKEQIGDMAYFEYANRLAPLEMALRKEGIWEQPHPWFSCLVPAAQLENYMHEALKDIQPTDYGKFPLVLNGLHRRHHHTPLFPTLKDETFFFLTFMPTVLPDSARVEQAAAFNYTLFKRSRALGGKYYSTGTLDLSQQDWKDHFGTNWEKLLRAKQRFDPDHVLTPGQNIFS
jgi:FAD/FMN-containing dehydrogenase